MARVALASVAALAVMGAAQASVLFHAAPSTEAPWAVAGDAPDGARMTVHVAVNRLNMDVMERHATAVSDPESPRYTEYLPSEKIAGITTNHKALKAVTGWLRNENVEHSVSKAGGIVTIDATVAEVERLFETSVSRLINAETSQTALRASDVRVPEEVVLHLEAVFGVHGLPLPPRDAVKAGTPADVTPDVINSAYNVHGVAASGNTKNRQAVAEFQGQLLNQSDLSVFFKKYVKSAAPGADKVYAYKGSSSTGEGVEANLDIQYIMGVAPGVKTEAWQYTGMEFCGDLKQWTQEILGESNPPNVFSVSYGWQGDMSQIGCSSSQISSIDADFKSIAAQGVGVIFASGDSGSAYNGDKLYASWPASSLWVTSVGATRFQNQQPGNPEQAVDQFGSGGGFSMLITPAPKWQKAAIASFYKNEPASKLPPQSDYGYGGRGTPDVAALGEGFQVIERGNPISVGGTSAAAPTFAGLVSLINDARIQAGKKAMGNLNAFIYKNPDVFTDITVGSDRVGRGGQQLSEGFDCVEGWDPVTGFGTPAFQKFLKAAMNA